MPDAPLNICLVVSDFEPRVGGISSYATQLAYALAEHPHVERVRVVALMGRETKVEHPMPKLEVRYMPLGNLLTLARRIYGELQASKGFVIHSPNVFPVGFFALLVCRFLLHKPCFVTFHGTDVLTKEGSAFTHLAKRFVLRHAVLVTVSHAIRDIVARRYSLSSTDIAVVYAPVKVHEASNDTRRYLSEDVEVLTVGNLVARKGIDDLIRAVACVKGVRLTVVGDGEEREALKRLAHGLGVSERVTFAGRVSSTAEYYKRADIFVLASYFAGEDDIEGLGIVLVEAQLYGLPVIGTKSGGIPEAFLDGESGLLVPERDREALTHALETLAQNPERRKAMGTRGREFASERFSARRAAQDYVAIYDRVS